MKFCHICKSFKKWEVLADNSALLTFVVFVNCNFINANLADD